VSVINAVTRARIKGCLEASIDVLIEQHRHIDPENKASGSSNRGTFKPFRAAIIPPEILRISSFERDLKASLSETFEECARLIALQYHAEAQRGYDITGQVSQAALNELERQVALFEHSAQAGESRPNLDDMIRAVLDARLTDDLVERTARADLYIRTRDNRELFFEIKSPVPNKGQCLEVTQRVLRFHLLREQSRPAVNAYFAMAYNPYGHNRADYRWSMAREYTPFEQMVVVGHEFWSLVAGEGAYEELLEIYREVGRAKSKYMIDALAFGF
jgi:hypothetical protein